MTDAFERSVSGQQNRAAFYGVDYTCYVEGGNNDHDRSADISFWYQVLSTCRPELSFTILPRGGKPILESLVRDIVSNDISNTIVAMDADYDGLTGDLITDRRALYSFGYSWENDVYDASFLPDLIKEVSHRNSVTDAEAAAIHADCERFASDVHRAIRMDVFALLAGSSVLPRDAPGRVIKQCPIAARPVIDKSELIKLCYGANVKTRPRPLPGIPSIAKDLRYLVGHCMAHAMAIVLRAALRRAGIKKPVSTDHLRDVAILLFGRQLAANPASPIAAHHRSQCGAIP